jgi:teichuronic acid biosynthesis glycosyltransferase TuaH
MYVSMNRRSRRLKTDRGFAFTPPTLPMWGDEIAMHRSLGSLASIWNRSGLEEASPPDAERPIVLLANVPFRSVWQRCHQLAAGLSEFSDVVYVDPNRSIVQRVRRGSGMKAGESLPSRLHPFSPPPGLPAARSIGLFNRLNYRRVGHALVRELRERRLWPPAAVVVTFPDQLDVLPYLPGVPLVYDLMDEPSLFLKNSQQSRYARLHEELLERADVLVVSARVLYDRYHASARRVVWVSNGVRDELIADVQTATPSPALLAHPWPRFGYVGMISHWFDFAAVKAIAEAFPQGSVLLVGPSDVRPPELPPNVVFTGPIPHAQLPSALTAFDVGLIPFQRSPQIDAVNPVKLYEYMAAGLPVLASGFEEVKRYRPLIETYDTVPQAVEAAVRLVSGERTREGVEERRAFARSHRWRSKAIQFAAAVKSVSQGHAASEVRPRAVS